MTERQKKIALIVGTIIIALILLLSGRKGTAGTVINNQGETSPINVTVPGFNIPERSPIAINIPGLPEMSPYNFNAISPCMCNGTALASASNVPALSLTFVTNMGDSGPNIYNYPATVAQDNYYEPVTVGGGGGVSWGGY